MIARLEWLSRRATKRDLKLQKVREALREMGAVGAFWLASGREKIYAQYQGGGPVYVPLMGDPPFQHLEDSVVFPVYRPG
jgi:hypothetical protein